MIYQIYQLSILKNTFLPVEMRIKKLRLNHKVFPKILLFLSAAVFSLFITELILLRYYPTPFFYKINFIGSNYKTFILSDNKKLLYIPKPDSGEFNSDGYRGKLIDLNRNSKKRIVFIGDSVIEGLNIPTQKRFSELLTENLGNKYEFINLGVPGYSFIQEYEYLKFKGLKYNPDFVFWGITINDFRRSSWELSTISRNFKKIEKNSFYKNYYRYSNQLDNWLLNFNIYRYLRYFFSTSGNNRLDVSITYKVNDEEILGLIKEIGSLARSKNINLIFFFLPANIDMANNEAKDMLIPVFKNLGIRYVDLDKDFQKLIKNTDKKNYFILKNDMHLNQEGHKILAEIFAKYIPKTN